MSRAHTRIIERDLSTIVPPFLGVYGAVAIPAVKGPVNVPTLVTNKTQLLKRYTPDEKLKVGYDNSYFSSEIFLERSNKLWVVRAANNPLYGGVVIISSGGAASNGALSAGQADPDAYTFGTDELFILTGADPGVWNNDISIKISTTNLKEQNAQFKLQIFKGADITNPVEEFFCSRKADAKDGYNRNIYLENVLQQSEYVRAVDNLVIADTEIPKDQTTALQFAQGDDGSAVTDGEMIAAINTLSNPDYYRVTALMDGGWSTVAYQTQLYTIAETRKDCIVMLSVPYAKEASANYLNDIVSYRNTDLNASTSYAGLFTPHVEMYDDDNNRRIFISPDGFAAAALSETAANYEMWYPIAGAKRGRLRALGLKRVFTDGEQDLLYDEGINPIRSKPGKGITIWGQKTLLGRPSRLDRMHVRQLLIVIEPAIKEALDDFLFDINDASTRALAEAKVTSYMKYIKGKRGVEDFRVVCNETNNSSIDYDYNRMNLWLLVKPISSVEEIPFITAIMNSTMTFSLAEQQLLVP